MSYVSMQRIPDEGQENVNEDVGAFCDNSVQNHNTMQYCNLDKKNNEEDELVTVMVS